MLYRAMMGETIRVQGHNGDQIDAYLARPLGDGPYPGVVVLHHMPGWDEATMEITRKFAHHGYVAICPNLHHRGGPGSPDDMAAATRARGGVPDDQAMGDVEGSVRYLRVLPALNGKVGIIGFCSGGRQSYLAACKVRGIDAAVDCWGGAVYVPPEEANPDRPAPIDFTAEMGCPLLGLFGNDDQRPSPEHVDRTEEALKQHEKTYEFHRYDGAGHGFFAVDRPGYRPVQAVDGWTKVFAWYEKYLGG